MEIREASDALAPLGLLPPDLEMLRPTEASYTCALLQPSGPVLGSHDRIGGLDQGLSQRKAQEFLRLARAQGAALAVAPEYFVPWSTLSSLIATATLPTAEALWVLGFESITKEALAEVKAAVAANCDLVFEDCDVLPADKPLLDPVVLLFNARKLDGTTRVVGLVQFKTHPSRDALFEEEALLKRGTVVYRLRGKCGTLQTAAIICSDAFATNEHLVGELVDRGTLIHIQLNPDPRNSAYRQYRKTTFELDPKASDCHIVCLNWARTIVQHNEFGHTQEWPAVGCSTWYCAADSCSCVDAIVVPNQVHGVYYAFMKERRHALLLDFDEAVFELRVPKVMTKGKGILANRNGPNSLARYVWASGPGTWNPQTDPPDASFRELLANSADAAAALGHIVDANPVDVERLLALSAAAITGSDSWHTVKEIDSFVVGSDEVVRRITVAQDDHPEAVQFRHARLDVAAGLRHLLNTQGEWPPQVDGTDHTAQLHWTAGKRNFNVLCGDGRPSLVVYMGERPRPDALKNAASMLTDLLRRAGGPYQKRLCVAFRDHGILKFAELPQLTRYDEGSQDERDLAAVDTSSVMEDE